MVLRNWVAERMAVTVDEYNRFCRSLPHTTYVVQWGGAHVWKVGGKVFAIGRWNDADQELFVTFKCSPMSYDMLQEMPGCRPAPYLASRGMKWIQRTSAEEIDDTGLTDYLRASYHQVVHGLPKRLQHELRLTDSASDMKIHPKAGPKEAVRSVAAKSRNTTRQKTTGKSMPARKRVTERKGAVR